MHYGAEDAYISVSCYRQGYRGGDNPVSKRYPSEGYLEYTYTGPSEPDEPYEPDEPFKPEYFEDDDFIYQTPQDGDYTVCVYGYNGGSTSTLKIPDYVKYNGNEYRVCSVGRNAITNISIRELYINGDLSMHVEAFTGTEIDTLYFKDGITDINNDGLGYLNVFNVVIPDSVTFIRSAAFYGNTSIEYVDMSKNVDIIYPMTFYGCSNLIQVTAGIPLHVYEDAFREANETVSIHFKAPSFRRNEIAYSANGNKPMESQNWTFDVNTSVLVNGQLRPIVEAYVVDSKGNLRSILEIPREFLQRA